MRSGSFVIAIWALLGSAAALSQGAGPAGPTSCAVQPAASVSDGDRSFAKGDFAVAESLYSGDINKSASDQAFRGLVNTQYEQHKLSDALASAQRAVATMPNSADAQTLLGETLLRAGKVSESTSPLSKALSLNPCSPHALAGLALYNGLISKHASAANQLATAHRLAPSDAEITAAWAITLPPEPQAAALKALLASNPTLPPAQIARLSATAALLEQGKTCTATWPEKPVKVDLWGLMVRGTHARGYGIKMHVGNTDIANVELDSSVSGIVLSPRDAKSAGVHPIGPTTPTPYYAVADSIRVGAAEFHNCPVRVASSESLANANSLVGTDFFRERLIHIDYITRTLILSPPATPAAGLTDRTVPPGEKDWTLAYFSGENILLPTLINKKGPYLMLLDTGSFASIYAPVIGNEHSLTYKDTQLPLRGSSTDIVKTIPQTEGGDYDHALVYGPGGKLLSIGIPIKMPDLHFYGNSRLDVDSLSFDISPKSREVGLELAGLLGFSVLKDFTIDIDYRNGLVHLVYDQLHRYAERELGRTD